MFNVCEHGETSSCRPQLAGISQGCPLSPFLFGIVMTILTRDAFDSLSESAKEAHRNAELGEVLYADDTLILGSTANHVGEYMQVIEARGRKDGLQIHWGKVELVRVCTRQPLYLPDGTAFEAKECMVYLGSTLPSGRSVTEISRRIGQAASKFKLLSTVWKNAAVSLKRKLAVFNSVVLSRLTYALSSAWLLQADLRRLNGFYCNCLRQILRIPSSYISRISNAEVLSRAGCSCLPDRLRQSQLRLLERVLNDTQPTVLREATFRRDSDTPLTAVWVRRRGRPRQNWVEELMKIRTSQ